MYDPGMMWPFTRKNPRASNVSTPISDPRLAGWFTPGGYNLSGSAVGESSVLGLSAFWRAVSLISGTLASLPFRTYRDNGDDGDRQAAASVFDDPDRYGQTSYEWKETFFLHQLLHGRAGGLKVTSGAGELAAIPLLHPMTWAPVLPTNEEYASGPLPVGGLWFDVRLPTGEQRRYDGRDFWYVPALSLDGKIGMSLISIARDNLGAAIAGDQAQSRMFSQGSMVSGIATPEDDLDEEELDQVRKALDQNFGGQENAGRIAIASRRLHFTPWSMTAVDAQFLQSRQFSVEDIARWTGVPPHLLMQTEKQTSWGTGVEEQNRALGRTVLSPWATRLESRATRLLRGRYCEFDFGALERPSPDRERELVRADYAAGLITLNEARRTMKLPSMLDGDTLKATPTPTGDSDATGDSDSDAAGDGDATGDSDGDTDSDATGDRGRQ